MRVRGAAPEDFFTILMDFEAKSTYQTTYRTSLKSSDSDLCTQVRGVRCVPTSVHSSHAYYTLPLWASTSSTAVRGVSILTNPLTHSRAYILLACSSSPCSLGLALALSSLQLACTPPLQLGTRLLRVALVSHSLPPSAACVGYV